MVLHRVEEFQISPAIHEKVRALLQLSFEDYPIAQNFLHQKPAFRYLLLKDKTLIGHMAVDHRIIQLAGKPISIFGITDLCVHTDFQHKKAATKMVNDLESLATEHQVDAMMLFTNLFNFYAKQGFTKQDNKCRWLMIQNHVSLGVARRSLEDCLMVKLLSDIEWTDGEVDLLGHVF